MSEADPLFDQLPEAASVLGPDLTVRVQNRLSRERGPGQGLPCHMAHFGRTERCPGCLVDEVLERQRAGRWFLTEPRGGRTTYYEITVAPIVDPAGITVALVELIRDATAALGLEQHLIGHAEKLEAEVEQRAAELGELTERTERLRAELEALRQDQAALIQTEKMASVGRLAAGLTHEIHTPLGALLSNLDLLRRFQARVAARLPGQGEGDAETAMAEPRTLSDTFGELLELQRLAAERIRRIVQSLRSFAHLDRAVEEPYDLHQGIDAALALLAPTIQDRIEVRREYAALPLVRCRPDALNQVFMNLLENAAAAIEGPGVLQIRTRVEGEGEVVVEFEDSGRGIPPEHLERIFEPGFTTKPRGVGTGLGLAIARNTLHEHGGRIEVASCPGRTVFTLRLPVRHRSS